MNRLRRFSAFAFSVVVLFGFLVAAASCAKSDYSGVYCLTRLQYVEDGELVTVNTGDLIDGTVLEEDFVVLELRQDGTAVLTVTDLVEDVSAGTWKAAVSPLHSSPICRRRAAPARAGHHRGEAMVPVPYSGSPL